MLMNSILDAKNLAVVFIGLLLRYNGWWILLLLIAKYLVLLTNYTFSSPVHDWWLIKRQTKPFHAAQILVFGHVDCEPGRV